MSDDFESRKVKEQRDHMQINGHPDYTEQDAREDLWMKCGRTWDGSGHCMKAGTEYCDWECPY